MSLQILKKICDQGFFFFWLFVRGFFLILNDIYFKISLTVYKRNLQRLKAKWKRCKICPKFLLSECVFLNIFFSPLLSVKEKQDIKTSAFLI